MRKLRLGELSAHVTGGPDGEGGGDGPVVVFLHGFGAPGTDLVPLAAELNVDRRTRFVFPMAPLALEAGAEDFRARAWWNIDIPALQGAVRSSKYEALFQHEPEGLLEARQKLESLLDAVEAELAPPMPLVIGGFSQGAMLATDTVVRTKRPFTGLVILSGLLIAEAAWRQHAPARRGLPVFQSHGTMDAILPYPAAEVLRERLRAAGLSIEWVPFQGPHGIPGPVLDRLAAFLERTTGAVQ